MQNDQPVSQQIKDLMANLKSVEGFRIPDVITEGIKVAASFLKAGNTNSALKAGLGVLEAGRGVLRAFLRNSAIDQPATDQKPAKTARFTAEVGNRRNHHDGPYDADIVARLEKKHDELKAAIASETGTVFTERIAAYNAMNAALKEADERQQQLDRTRAEVERQKVRTADILEARPRRKEKRAPRTELILRHEAEADELLALI